MAECCNRYLPLLEVLNTSHMFCNFVRYCPPNYPAIAPGHTAQVHTPPTYVDIRTAPREAFLGGHWDQLSSYRPNLQVRLTILGAKIFDMCSKLMV